MPSSKVKHLIVDTTAFIKCTQLQEYAENILTTNDVVNEVKNRKQLRRLAVVPYDIKVQDPFSESLAFVTEFSKKTGDYPSLSSTDLQVIALTYQLEKEIKGDEHLKKAPEPKKVNLAGSEANNTQPQDSQTAPSIAGFYRPKNGSSESNDEEDAEDIEKTPTNEQIEADLEEEPLNEPTEGEISDEDDDDDGWITPSNIKAMKQKAIDTEDLQANDEEVTVACMTTDFAMQNVLKQIGLHIIAIDGKLIKQIRTYVLRCYACFKLTSIMTKKFCPNCGHSTLKKVSVSVNDQGEQVVHINTRRPLTARGKKFSLPTPRGGKHTDFPILYDDQPVPDQRPSRLARTKNNPLNPDYIAGYSPFVTRDVYSKSAILGIKGKHAKVGTRNGGFSLKNKCLLEL